MNKRNLRRGCENEEHNNRKLHCENGEILCNVIDIVEVV